MNNGVRFGTLELDAWIRPYKMAIPSYKSNINRLSVDSNFTNTDRGSENAFYFVK
jgi:hypothetical protein